MVYLFNINSLAATEDQKVLFVLVNYANFKDT